MCVCVCVHVRVYLELACVEFSGGTEVFAVVGDDVEVVARDAATMCERERARVLYLCA